MSYQVLARKWRPATFEQMVGQSHVLLALTNALSQQRLHHAYLFSGTRGVGKTSLARLFAKGLNCEQGVTATPCGKCSACVEISEGRFVDLIEVDAASRTKVDDTRELLDNVQYRPSRGRYKVYLIDEVHMLSRSSFNALLKTLEEPPEHVKFLLATTDPQRLPVTVLSRCLQFNLKSLSQTEITTQLVHILGQEQLPFDEAALATLAKAANGSMRDALSLADQAIAFGGGKVELAQVQTMLGSIDDKQVIALLNALIEADIPNLMQVTHQILSFGSDAQEVLRSLLELLHQITLTQFAPAAAQLSLYSKQISEFAEQLSPEQVQLYYQLLLTGRKDLPHAPDPKSGLEMALLRVVAFVPETPVTAWATEGSSEQSPNTGRSSKISASISTEAKAVNSPKQQASTPHSVAPESNSHHAPSLERAQVAPSTASNENIDDDEAALNSEMAVILSQAQSQGAAQGEALPPNTPETPAQLQPPLAARAGDDNTASTHSRHAPQDIYEPYANVPMPDDSEPMFDSYETGEQQQYSIAPSEPVKPEPQANMPSSAPDALASQPAVDSGVDDLLDAVLATNSLLMAPTTEATDTASAKKSSTGRAAYVPPVRKKAPEQKPENDTSQSQTQLPASITPEVSSASEAEKETEKAAETTDRPPWETPHELDNIARFSDEGLQAPECDSQGMSPVIAQAMPADKQNVAPAPMPPAPADSKPMVPVTQPSDDITGNDIDLAWYRLMATIKVGGRVRQLGVNSVCHGFTQPLTLLLKPDQKHLSAEIAINQLEQALADSLGQECTIKLTVGVDNTRETPLEVRRRFHKELNEQAHYNLMSDENVQWLTQHLDAEFEFDSLSYSPELLVEKGHKIPLIGGSDFKALPES